MTSERPSPSRSAMATAPWNQRVEPAVHRRLPSRSRQVTDEASPAVQISGEPSPSRSPSAGPPVPDVPRATLQRVPEPSPANAVTTPEPVQSSPAKLVTTISGRPSPSRSPTTGVDITCSKPGWRGLSAQDHFNESEVGASVPSPWQVGSVVRPRQRAHRRRRRRPRPCRRARRCRRKPCRPPCPNQRGWSSRAGRGARADGRDGARGASGSPPP